jgi:hypothetical protein
VIVLRRRLEKPRKPARKNTPGQPFLPWDGLVAQAEYYELAGLVTHLPDEILTLAQHSRDGADAEHVFDELHHQWGWGGYTTQDWERCQRMARIGAQVYNWWSIFGRLAFPSKHREGISSRPWLLSALGKPTQPAGPTKLVIPSSHAKAPAIPSVLTRLSAFFRHLLAKAEQLTQYQPWLLILSAAFKAFLPGTILSPRPELAPASG